MDYSHIDNITNLNLTSKLKETDNISVQNFVSTALNLNHLKNNRVDMTQQFSHLSDSDSQSACRFEGGE